MSSATAALTGGFSPPIRFLRKEAILSKYNCSMTREGCVAQCRPTRRTLPAKLDDVSLRQNILAMANCLANVVNSWKRFGGCSFVDKAGCSLTEKSWMFTFGAKLTAADCTPATSPLSAKIETSVSDAPGQLASSMVRQCHAILIE